MTPQLSPPCARWRWLERSFVASIVLIALVTAAPALAGDPQLALDEVILVPDISGANRYFGAGVAGGDFDADGYADLAVGEPGLGAVYLFAGSPMGLAHASAVTLTPQRSDYPNASEFFGGTVAAFDADADGYDDLAVAASDSESVFIYRGAPGGIVARSEWLLMPVDGSDFTSSFGYAMRAGGDTDGDGFEELLVGDQSWRADGPGEPFSAGAIFVYPGSEAGTDKCAERRLELPDRPAVGYTSFGGLLEGDGDLNGDGYADVVAACSTCDRDEQGPQDETFTFLGGVGGLGAPEPTTLHGGSLALIPDADGDGFDDVVIGDPLHLGTRLLFGSPSGLDQATFEQVSDTSYVAAGLGDVDGDGFGDLLTGHWSMDEASVGIVFGSGDRADYPERVVLDHAGPIGDAWGGGDSLFALGDINADGHPEFAASAIYTNSGEGSLSVFTPVCTWYRDADADGFGDAAASLSSCHTQVGYVPRPDDCDDADASTHGSVGYRDADGDGYGTSEGELACAPPSSTAAVRFDCDDTTAGRNPAAEDVSVDGIDQDCDDHDGPWVQDTGDCEDPDTGDTGVDTGAPPDDSAADSPGDSPTVARDPGCRCAFGPGSGWLPGVAGLALLVGRARAPGGRAR